MKDFVYEGPPSNFKTPVKKTQRNNDCYSEVYLNSIRKQKLTNRICSLCLFHSDDSTNLRCHNRTHFVCSECACDWQYDKTCPVCKKKSPPVSWKDTISEGSIWTDNDKRMNSYRIIEFIDSKEDPERNIEKLTKKSIAWLCVIRLVASTDFSHPYYIGWYLWI